MSQIFMIISDHGNVFISKFITYFGLSVGLGVGTAQAIASNVSHSELVQTCAEASPGWLAYAPFIAAISLAIKHITDVVLRFKESKHNKLDKRDD